jgi:type IV pilus assembly protein PilN
MARINLLPWRAERRAARKKEFYVMLGFAAVGGILLSVLLLFYYGQMIDGQSQRNAFMKNEIAKLDAQIKEIEELDKKKGRLLSRKLVIEQLQANRSQMVHLFDSLARTIPDGVMLTSVKQDGDLLTLEGNAQSNARVSAYMRALETSGWMTKPELGVIEAKSEVQSATAQAGRALPYQFSLQVRLSNPNANTNGDGKPNAPVPAAPATTPGSATTPPVPAPTGQQPAPATQTKPVS